MPVARSIHPATALVHGRLLISRCVFFLRSSVLGNRSGHLLSRCAVRLRREVSIDDDMPEPPSQGGAPDARHS